MRGLHTASAWARTIERATLLALAMFALAATHAAAVPAFAIQTGQPCNACHVGGFGPRLTPFGRSFKIGGYTARTDSFNVPLSAMAVASYVRTLKAQPGPPAPGFSANDNFAIDQISLFVAGGVGGHLGGFIQTTYDGVAKAFHWDNLDLRAVTTVKVKGKDLVLGATLNNAPTVQDGWNSLAAWGYPFTTSNLAPHPAASPLLAGALAQNTLGLTAYAWLNNEFYSEVGGYRSPSADFLIHAGVDPTAPGDISGTAPYGRIAYQKNFGDHNFEVGAFGMAANIFPGRDHSAGASDHFTDLGLDASFQIFRANKDVIMVNARYTHENQRLDASLPLGLAQNPSDSLSDIRVDAAYYWRDKIGLTIAVFDTWGSPDALLYPDARTFRPDSDGVLLQLDGTPWGAGGSPLGRRFNMRLGIQYVAYGRFNGAGANFDGAGRNASDNNTLRVFSWIAY
jgi:hypothetical protein